MAARSRASPSATPATRSGSSTFSTAESVGSNPNDWKTTPIRERRSSVRSSRDIAATGASRQRTSPSSGASRPLSTPMNVVLPEPLGPISATKSRSASESDAPRTARTPCAPV